MKKVQPNEISKKIISRKPKSREKVFYTIFLSTKKWKLTTNIKLINI